MHEYGCPHRDGYGYDAKCLCEGILNRNALSEHSFALDRHREAMESQRSKDEYIEQLLEENKALKQKLKESEPLA